MRTILFIIQKEFLQLSRNRIMIPIIFVVPLVQLIILVNAATMEMKNIDLVIMDQDNSRASRDLVSKFTASPFFRIKNYTNSDDQASRMLLRNQTAMVIKIPRDFEHDLVRNSSADVQVQVNAINGTVAAISSSYVGMIIAGFNSELVVKWFPSAIVAPGSGSVNIISTYWYNPELNYKIFMVPAILAILVTMIGMFLSGLNMVREKELGTIEQINVTPIRKYQFIIGKLIPFWIIALIELTVGLILGKLLFSIPIIGSLWLIYGVTMIYLLVVLGLGLFISTVSETQQQAMFITFFFMLVFIMLSGIFTPVESMPGWAQKLDMLNPVAYYMRSLRMIMLKGSTFIDIRLEFFLLLGFAASILSLSVWRYRKKS